MKMINKCSKLLLIAVIIITIPTGVFAKENGEKSLDYVALGDSLAAGVTPLGFKDLGYPDYIKKRFEQSQVTINLSNYAVPGYTSIQLRKEITSNENVRSDIKEAEIVTIDIGANDLLFALKNYPSLVGETINNVRINVASILQTIDQLNPNVDVYVMGYYNPFPYKEVDVQEKILPLLRNLNEAIQLDAVVNGDIFVPTEKVIGKKYENYLTNPDNIHLSKEGYQIIAKEFWKAIDNN